MEPLVWYRIAAPAGACAGLVLVAILHSSPRLRFAALGMVTMVVYGIVQDQISARLCPEYFTVFHPPISGLTDPTLLGIVWGFLGAWWGGVALGYSLGLAATLGSRPPLTLRDIRRPLGLYFLAVAICTGVTGLNVWRHAEMFGVSLEPGLTKLIPIERQQALLVVSCYHFAAYTSAILGGVVLCLWVGLERRRQETLEH